VYILITNRKSHTGFRLVPTSMTLDDLDDLEWRKSPYLAFFFADFDFFCWSNTSQWLNIDLLSVNIVSQFESSTFGHN